MVKPGAGDDRSPLYYQIRNDVLSRIEQGEFLPGDMLPSEDELSAYYGVSNITVKRAMLDLASEGVVVRKQGKGTFVKAPVIEEDLSLAGALAKPMLMHADTGFHRLLSAGEIGADAEVSKALLVEKGSRVTKIERLKVVGDEPLGYERSFVPVGLCPGLGEKMQHDALTLVYDVLKSDYGLHLTRARLLIEPTILRAGEARLLGTTRGRPAMLWTRTTYATGDRPVEFYKAVVRGDRFKYYLEFPSKA